MWAYGYDKKYAFFFELSDQFKGKDLTIKATWLVCKDICIPESQTIVLPLNQNLEGELKPCLNHQELKQQFQALPLSNYSSFDLFLSKGKKENQLVLHYLIEGIDLNKIDLNQNIIFPYPQFPFDYKHEEIFINSQSKMLYGRIPIDWDGIYEDPILKLPDDGIFSKAIFD